MVKRRDRLVAGGAIVLLLAACSSSKPSGTSSATTQGPAGTPGSSSALPNVNQHFTASGPLMASAPGITPSTIKLGYITSQTGVAASSFKGGEVGAQARIDLQNAQGGIDGRQIELVTADDGALGPKPAAQQIVENDGAFGVIDVSAFVVGAAPYLQQQGVPVTGGAFDGPEWGQQPYENMFTTAPPAYTPFDGKYYTYTGVPMFLKSVGVTKMASFAYGISESAIQANKSVGEAAAPLGISSCYTDNSVQFGQSSFTTESLAVQRENCNGVISAMVDASDVGLAAALKQGGFTGKEFYYTGYDQGVLNDPNASAALDGSYFPAGLNFTDPPTGVQEMLNTLHKYAPQVTGIPSIGVYDSYLAADVMIEGLKAAGENPTRQSFISNLRGVSNYDGYGLFAQSPLSFTGFGTPAMFPQQECSDYVQLKSGKFVTVARNVCGQLVSTS